MGELLMGTRPIRVRMLYVTLAISLLAAGSSCAIPFVIGPPPGNIQFRYAVVFSAAWSILTTYALVRYRKRGLWALVGLPMALFWPLVLFMLELACKSGDCI